jgi:hypothetical protein
MDVELMLNKILTLPDNDFLSQDEMMRLETMLGDLMGINKNKHDDGENAEGYKEIIEETLDRLYDCQGYVGSIEREVDDVIYCLKKAVKEK